MRADRSGESARALGFAITLASSAAVSAQDYPARPVRTVIGFPPGGPNDLAMRPMAQKLRELLGQPFVIDYRPGANSVIGAEHVDSIFIAAPPAIPQIRAGKAP